MAMPGLQRRTRVQWRDEGHKARLRKRQRRRGQIQGGPRLAAVHRDLQAAGQQAAPLDRGQVIKQLVQPALKQASQRSMEIARAMAPTPRQLDRPTEQPTHTKQLQTLLDSAKQRAAMSSVAQPALAGLFCSKLVRGAGLEPACLAARDFKSRMATDFIIPAKGPDHRRRA